MNRKQVTFVAMSGVRIYDRELVDLGMTLPGFIERGKVIASLPSLGVLTLAGHTPPDWEVSYLDIDEFDLDQVTEQTHALVAISSLTARIYDAYRLADHLRAHGRTVVIGGLHASVRPDEVACHADAVVIGEGEAAWPEVLRDYEAGTLKPRYEGSRARDFDPWAVPRYDLLDPEKYNRITIQTTRGCPLDCTFCGASRLISSYKRKPIDQIERELDAIEAIWPRPFIELADDNTFVHKAWSRDLVRAIGRRGIRWFTESDVSLADDPELLRDLAASGCVQVLVGFEAVGEDALDETDTKHWKRNRRHRYLDAIHRIQDSGISVNGCFIFGFDNHGPNVFEKTNRFIQESGLAEVQLTILTPFPGTALFDRLQREGRLLEEEFWDRCTLFDVTFQPSLMTPEELRSGFRELVRETYSEARSADRKKIFNDCIRRAKASV